MKKNISIIIVLLAALTWALAGCGGGGGGGVNSPGASGRGEVRLNIHWPAASTKLIPIAAKSITLSAAGPGNQAIPLTYNGNTNNVIVVARPPAGQNSTNVALTNLPATSLVITASAFPNSDGSGEMQATGSQTVNISATTPANVSITMGSTVTTISVSIAAGPLAPGAILTATATATDSSGNLVMVAPSTWKWTSSNPAVATVTGSGTDGTAIVKGVAAGSATITANVSR
jgi:hypothetical protein